MERLFKKTDTLVIGTLEHSAAVAWNNAVRDIASHMRVLDFVQVSLVSERHGVDQGAIGDDCGQCCGYANEGWRRNEF